MQRRHSNGAAFGPPRSVAFVDVTRIETTQGALARRGFTDTGRGPGDGRGLGRLAAALLELLGEAADPDLALYRSTGWPTWCRTCTTGCQTSPELARKLIMVLGGSGALGQHLIAHPDHLDLLDASWPSAPPPNCAGTCSTAVGADPEAASRWPPS